MNEEDESWLKDKLNGIGYICMQKGWWMLSMIISFIEVDENIKMIRRKLWLFLNEMASIIINHSFDFFLLVRLVEKDRRLKIKN
jgi:hypothetical protein